MPHSECCLRLRSRIARQTRVKFQVRALLRRGVGTGARIHGLSIKVLVARRSFSRDLAGSFTQW